MFEKKTGDAQTDGQTDRRTDTSSYRDARAHLKKVSHPGGNDCLNAIRINPNLFCIDWRASRCQVLFDQIRPKLPHREIREKIRKKKEEREQHHESAERA